MPRESVHGDNVSGFVVPGTVFTPVVGGDFFPRVIKGAGRGKDSHNSRVV